MVETSKIRTGLVKEDYKILSGFVLHTGNEHESTALFYYNIKWAVRQSLKDTPDAEDTFVAPLFALLDLPKISAVTLQLNKDEMCGPGNITRSFFDGELPSAEHFAECIPALLQGIRLRIQKTPSLILQGRNDEVRLNFDPDASDITSIKNKLNTICYRGGLTERRGYDSYDPRAACEWLLRAIVHWDTTAFADIPGTLMLSPELIPKQEAEAHAIHCNSCLRWLGMKLIRFDVITAAKGKEVVQFLMEEIRVHILMVAASGKTLPFGAQILVDDVQGKGDAGVFAWRWSLLSSDDPRLGFAPHFLACFDRKTLTSEEYEDLLEQQFYKLRRAVGGARVTQDEDDADYFELEKDPGEGE